MLTAPNRPMDFRVGARSCMGSLCSGGIHILMRDPCCWKWHSSKLHKSTPLFFASLRRFFKSLLFFRISFGNQRTRFAKSKPQFAENTLALPNTQFDPVSLPKMMREQFTIPYILRIVQIPWLLAKSIANRLPLLLAESLWTSWTFAISQTGKTVCLEFLDQRSMVVACWPNRSAT